MDAIASDLAIPQCSAAPAARGQCRKCRYDLRGIECNLCPECGTDFNPDDPQSMFIARRPPRWAQALSKRTRWIAWASIPLMLLLIVAHALFISTLELLWLYFYFWTAIALPYLLKAFIRFSLSVIWPPLKDFWNVDRKARQHIALVFLPAGLILILHIMPLLTFWISSHWLEPYAAKTCLNYGEFQPPGDFRIVGLLPIRTDRALMTGVDFQIGYGYATYLRDPSSGPFHLGIFSHWKIDFGTDPWGAWKIVDWLSWRLSESIRWVCRR
jgi:hypothetical protein